MRYLLLLLAAAPAFAQFLDLATDRTGSILMLRTQFRLVSEGDVASEDKIYRYQNGAWSRVTAYVPTGGIIPGNISSPFVAGDGSIYGWSLFPSHGLFPVLRPQSVEQVTGMTLPSTFPREFFRVSANGRYAAGGILDSAAEIFDSVTSKRTVLPIEARNPQVADDGTYAYSTDAGTVIVQPPAGASHTMTVAGLLQALSADGQWAAIVAQDGSLRIAATASGALAAILPAPPASLQRSWSLSNRGVVYIAGDRHRVQWWDSSTGAIRVLIEDPVPFSETVVSADGAVAWVVAETNWMLRFDLKAGIGTEFLPPLGHSTAGISGAVGVRVPGSAILLPGKFTRNQQVTVDGALWPLSDVNGEGYWVQVPWEWHGRPDKKPETLLVRTQRNPFEDMSTVAYDGESFPNFLRRIDNADPRGWILAAHQDFGSLVTPQSPARSGETIHVYMTGLGPLQRPVPTGTPGPMDAVRIAGPLTCVGVVPGSVVRSAPLSVPAAIYAPGMTGFYQVDVTIPAGVPNGEWFLQCGNATYEAVALVSTRP